jgi:SOS-response transcriptional repressor LexA
VRWPPFRRWPLFRVVVAEPSMVPAVYPGDWLLVLRTRRIRPGQLVIARNPEKPDMLLVKRAARRTPDGHWWLTSDNPYAAAIDSSRFGPVGNLEGKILFRMPRPRPRS